MGETRVNDMVTAQIAEPRNRQFAYRRESLDIAKSFCRIAALDRDPPSPLLLNSATNGTWEGVARTALNKELRELAAIVARGPPASVQEDLALDDRKQRAALAFYFLDLSERFKAGVRSIMQQAEEVPKQGIGGWLGRLLPHKPPRVRPDTKTFKAVVSVDVARRQIGEMLEGFFAKDNRRILLDYEAREASLLNAGMLYNVELVSLQDAIVKRGYFRRVSNEINGIIARGEF